MKNTSQSTLFKLQLWHLRQARVQERLLLRIDKRDPAADGTYARHVMHICVRQAKRRLKLHRKFVDAITPFVRTPILPLPAPTELKPCPSCRHGIRFDQYCGQCEQEMHRGPFLGRVRRG